MDPAQAGAEAARRRVKRANGLLKDAVRDLASIAAGDFTTLGTVHVHDAPSGGGARDLIALGVARHGAVDVVVIARPTGRAHPTTAPHPRGEGDPPHGPRTLP